MPLVPLGTLWPVKSRSRLSRSFSLRTSRITSRPRPDLCRVAQLCRRVGRLRRGISPPAPGLGLQHLLLRAALSRLPPPTPRAPHHRGSGAVPNRNRRRTNDTEWQCAASSACAWSSITWVFVLLRGRGGAGTRRGRRTAAEADELRVQMMKRAMRQPNSTRTDMRIIVLARRSRHHQLAAPPLLVVH